MAQDSTPLEPRPPAVEAHLLGCVDFDRVLALQHRLVDEAAERHDGQIRLLIGEPPPVVTIGRGGSPADVRYDVDLVRQDRIDVRWVKRGGGCLVHLPGQLAVYPIVPLERHGMTPGGYLHRLHWGIEATLTELGFPVRSEPGRWGLWGRTGQVVAFGVAVRRWVTYHGAYINVCPSPGLLGLVETAVDESSRMSSLVAEHRGRVHMTAVRATLVRHLSESLGCDRYHLHTGHPWLRDQQRDVSP
jgi:lipoyl(octanoyl) transferase